MRLNSLLIFFSILISTSNQAQQITFDIQKIEGFKAINSITNIKTDQEGFVWIVTFGAVQRYDGNQFKKINTNNINHASFLYLSETARGKKYLIDLAGLIYFIEADTIRAYKYNHLLRGLNERNRFRDAHFDLKDRLHISYDGSGYNIIDTNGNITDPFKEKGVEVYGQACILRTNRLPFIARKFHGYVKEEHPYRKQYYYIFDQNLNLIDKREIVKREFHYNPSIVQKSNGNFLFSSGKGNLFEFNKHGFIKEIEYSLPIVSLLIDNHQGLWLSTHQGINYYKNADVENDEKIIVNKKPYSIAASVDYEGGIWFYTSNELEYLLSPTQKLLTQKDGFLYNDDVHDIELVNDKLYASHRATDKISIIDYKNQTLDSLSISSLIKDKEKGGALNDVNFIYYDEKEKKTWITKRGELFYRTKDEWIEVSTKKLDKRINPIYIFSKKLYQTDYSLAGFYNNIFFLVKDDSIHYVSPKYPERIANILIKEDSIFVATYEGLYLHIGDNITKMNNQYPKLNGYVKSLDYFQDKLWVNVQNVGTFVVLADSLKMISYKNTPLIGSYLVKTDSNELWMLGENGSFLFDAREQKLSTNPTPIKAYKNKGAGYITKSNSNLCYQNTANKGIRIVNFNEIKKDTLFPPRLSFINLKIAGKKIDRIDSIFYLAHNESFIQLSYRGVSFFGDEILYRHRMLGLQEGWIETEDNYIQFTTLPAGEYTFEIQCRRVNQMWSQSKFLHFQISPPFWQTWWFISLSALIILFITYQIINYRFKIVRKEKNLIVDRLKAEQKALRAQMSPHFIFNIVASFRHLVNNESIDKTNQFLTMFSRSMRNVLSQANENHITIRNEIQFLKEYIEMERFRLEDHFDYEIHQSKLDEQLDRLIPPFIIQPFVENAIHHGLKKKKKDGFLSLHFEANSTFLEVTINDNGIGRDRANLYKSERDRSYGIRLIKDRLALHNERSNNIIIEDLFDKNNIGIGTRITLYIRILDKLENLNESINY